MLKLKDAKRRDCFQLEPTDLTIITDEKHPLFDPRIKLPLSEALVLSVMEHGIRENIRAFKLGDQVIVTNGRQRVRAALEANKRLKDKGLPTVLVPTMLSTGEEADLYEESIYLNEQRQDDDAFGKARKAQKLLGFGRTEKQVGATFGVSGQTIKNWLKVFELDPEVRAAVKSGKVNITAASELADLPAEEQKIKLSVLMQEGGKVTVQKARRAARGTAKRPGLARLKAILKHSESGLIEPIPDYAQVLLRWIVGEIDEAAAKHELPWL